VQLWVVFGVMAAGMLAALWSPMRTAWTCYLMHEQGQRAQAEFVKQLDDGKLVLLLTTGPQAGQACMTGSVPEAAAQTTGRATAFWNRPSRHPLSCSGR